MVTDRCQVARSWIEIPLQGRLKSNSRLIVGALSLLIFSDASSCPDTVHFFGIGEEANLSAGSYMLWRSISHIVNLVLRLQQPYYDIRCSWSVLDHHAADKENEADLARSWHWFLHLGKDIWLIFCSSLSDTCSCQSLWQGRHGNWMTLKHIRLCWYLLAYTSQFEFMVADEFSTCQQWMSSPVFVFFASSSAYWSLLVVFMNDWKVMFICNHCPYVIHLKEDIVKLANNYIPVCCSL